MNKTKIHILIVEDDMVDRMACRRGLAQDTNFEYVLSEVDNGRDGLQYVHTHKTDCILLDYNLPDMNGLNFFSELKSSLNENVMPVIMLTGADNTSVAVEAIKLGVQDYLVKDVNLNYLQLLPTVIQRVVREREALEELNLHRSRMEDMVSKRTTKFENRSAILESANANLASKLEECTQAGAALKKHANQYVDLFNTAPCCYYSLDAEGVFLQINDTGIKLLGYPRDKIVGKMKFADFLTSESKDTFLKSYQQLKEIGVTRNLELKVTDKNGAVLDVLLNSAVIKDSQNMFVMSRIIMVDISDRNGYP